MHWGMARAVHISTGSQQKNTPVVELDGGMLVDVTVEAVVLEVD